MISSLLLMILNVAIVAAFPVFVIVDTLRELRK